MKHLKMKQRETYQSENKVTNLFPPIQACPKRVNMIRAWHAAQAIQQTNPIAICCITVTECGQVEMNGLGIEPEHASIIIDQLQHLASILSKKVTVQVSDQNSVVRSISAG